MATMIATKRGSAVSRELKKVLAFAAKSLLTSSSSKPAMARPHWGVVIISARQELWQAKLSRILSEAVRTLQRFIPKHEFGAMLYCGTALVDSNTGPPPALVALV